MSEEESVKKVELTETQRARIERNKQRALLLKKARLINNPYPVNSVSHAPAAKITNTGGGFIPEDNPAQNLPDDSSKTTVTPSVILDPTEKPNCNECSNPFEESFLYTHYGFPTCDGCRDKDEKHSLIPKTQALKEYLLKDCDLDKREPPLKYMVKKNPHTSRGDMKLYLRCQVEDRALEVWGSEEALEEAHEKREVDREKRKEKAYEKKIKTLRMEVRSSLFRKEQKSHVHNYGPETYVEDEDVYQKKCNSCNHIYSYEKM